MSPASSSQHPPDGRSQRLLQERERLEMLAASSSALRISKVTGEPPTEFDLSFTLEGEPMRQLPVERRPETPAVCRLTLGEDFPRRPPQARWLSRMWHPNVSQFGVVPWEALELPWDRKCRIEDVVARLWEILSWKRFDTAEAVNAPAARWFAEQGEPPILDLRGLRDLAEHQQSVVVGYRRDARGLTLYPWDDDHAPPDAGATADAERADSGIFFLDDQGPKKRES